MYASAYGNLSDFLSLNYPRAWRLRIDFLLMVALALYLLAFILNAVVDFSPGGQLNVSAAGEPGGVAGSIEFFVIPGLILGFCCLASAGYWLYSIAKHTRIKEVVRLGNSPSFTALFVGTALLLGPILYLFYPVMQDSFLKVGFAAQAGIPPEEILDESAIVAFILLFYSITLILPTALFVKIILSSSPMWAFGGTVAGLVWSFAWILVLLIFSSLLKIIPFPKNIFDFYTGYTFYIILVSYFLSVLPLCRDLFRKRRSNLGFLSAIFLPGIIPIAVFTVVFHILDLFGFWKDENLFYLLQNFDPSFLIPTLIGIVALMYSVSADFGFYALYRISNLPQE